MPTSCNPPLPPEFRDALGPQHPLVRLYEGGEIDRAQFGYGMRFINDNDAAERLAAARTSRWGVMLPGGGMDPHVRQHKLIKAVERARIVKSQLLPVEFERLAVILLDNLPFNSPEAAQRCGVPVNARSAVGVREVFKATLDRLVWAFVANDNKPKEQR